jgi:hypothetical protein
VHQLKQEMWLEELNIAMGFVVLCCL